MFRRVYQVAAPVAKSDAYDSLVDRFMITICKDALPYFTMPGNSLCIALPPVNFADASV